MLLQRNLEARLNLNLQNPLYRYLLDNFHEYMVYPKAEFLGQSKLLYALLL